MYKNTGFISFFLRRFTGLVLVLYLGVHMWVIGAATKGAETFNARLELFESPALKILEILLLAGFRGFLASGLAARWRNLSKMAQNCILSAETLYRA